MKTRLSLFALILVLLLSGCTQVIPNAEVCADKGLLGAKCAFTRFGEASHLSKGIWDKTRVGWFCLDPGDFGKYQKFIETSCAENKNCVDEVNQFVSKLKE